MPAAKPKAETKPQFERFMDAVRENGADETDEALERAIQKLAPPKHQTRAEREAS